MRVLSMDIKVSVIVPVYNVEQYLERCLNSLINQTLKDIEIICVNDGSTDSSLSILENFAAQDNRIKIINQNNQGPSIARNSALKLTTGEYIGYVDSDDCVSDNFFELLYNNAKKYNADIACGEIIRPNAKKHVKFMTLKRIKVYNKTEDKYKACQIPEKSYICNKIYKRTSLINSKIEFEPGVTYEDMKWIHVVVDKLGSLVTVPKAIYYYFENPNSITRTQTKEHLKDFYKACSDCIEYLMLNRIKVRNFKKYRAKKRIRVKILGIRLFDFLFWDSVRVYHVLGFPILKIYITEIK